MSTLKHLFKWVSGPVAARLPALLLAGVVLASCGGGEDRSKAQLRLINASQGYAELDLIVDDQRRQDSVAYGATDRYVEVDPDETATEITRPGSATPLASTVPALREGDRYSLVAYGAEGALRTVLLADNTDDPDRGEALVRVLNAAPDAGALDIYLTSADAPLADAEALQTGAEAGEVSGFTVVDEGSWRLRITAAGDRDDLRLDLSGIQLASRQIVSVVVTPGAGGVLVNALLVTQRGAIETLNGAQARVRTVAAVTSSGTVSATVNGVALMNGTGAPAAGPYRLVPAGDVLTVVAVNGTSVTTPAATLAAGTDHTLLVWGPATAPAAAWIADDNRLPSVTGRAKLRLVHGVADFAPVLALTLDFSPVADAVSGGTASTPLLVDAGTDATLTVTATGLATPLFTAVEQNLVADGVYSLFVVGAADAPVGFLRKDR